MATALKKNVAKRKGLRTTAMTLCTGIENIMKDVPDEKRIELLAFKTTLVDTIEQLKELDDLICSSLSLEDIETDVVETGQFYLRVNTCLMSLSAATTPADQPPASISTRTVEKSVIKLPKIELTKFNGDPLRWQSFWDQFKSAIDENDTLSEIDKFNYLRGYLTDSARMAIGGLELTTTNYKEAVKILIDRYGNEQVLINAHMETLLRIESVKSMRDIHLLRKLYNDVENCVRNLKSLNYDSDKLSLIMPILNDRIPHELKMIVSRNFGSEKWTVEKMLEFINNELKARERCYSGTTPSNSTNNNNHGNQQRRRPNTTDSFLTTNSERCVFCRESHPPSRCLNVTNTQTRSNILKREGRCFLCLQNGHISKTCSSNYLCRKCNKRHHISLCTKDKRDDRNNDSEKTPEEEVSVNVSSLENENKGILLQTARGHVSKERNSRKHVQIRFIFDSASQRTYVTDEMRKKLDLEIIRHEKLIINTFGHSRSELKEFPIVRLYVKTADKPIAIEAISVPKICTPLTNQTTNYYVENHSYLRNLNLADSDRNDTLPVDSLIGLDNYYSFITGRVIRGDGPTAISSKLGWILAGGHQGTIHESNCFEIHTMRVDTENETLRNELNKFWQLESVDEIEEKNVMNSFERTLEFNGERYVTELPFRPDHDRLPDNYAVSKQRLESLVTKRLKPDPELAERYSNIFDDYESKNIIEKVPESEIANENVYYLPHHPVIREDKATTKIRPVFDGSCNVNKPSLNDVLYSGPNLLANIFDVLLRFRTNYIALVADIQKAFLNIEIAEKDRDFLRFLWKENPTEAESQVIVYRFLRVVFGLTCSPFLLNGTIKHHLEIYEQALPELVDLLKRDFYVDDLSTGVDSVSAGKELYENSKRILKEGGFDLRKWITNSPELQTYFDENEPDLINIEKLKVLGIEWDTKRDMLIYRFDEILSKAKQLPRTKRNILRIAASFYDPLGLISPITSKLKVIFQLCCQSISDWDEIITGEPLKQWETIIKELEQLQIVEIPRYTLALQRTEIEMIEIHGFSDSSSTAYSAAIYLKIRTTLGIHTSLLAAKTKVAPLRSLSIPRLELLGCVLLAKLMKHVRNSLDERLKVDRVFGWTDSEVALCWLKGKLKQWKPWVENRVIHIRSVIPPESWYHVPGSHNPSDIPTRVDRVCDVVSDLWLTGPEFLRDEGFVPFAFHSSSTEDSYDVLVEAKKGHTTANVAHSTHIFHPQLHEIIDETKFSSIRKLVTTVGYVLRFANKLLKRVRIKNIELSDDPELTTTEYNYAFKLLIKNEQNRFRNDETYYKKLSNSLKLFEDENGYLRVHGRFGENEKLSYDERYPLILQKHSHLSELIIIETHENVCHQGVEVTHNTLRSRFWIPQGRRMVKSVLRKCVTCRRYQAKPLASPPTPDLPVYRYIATRAFEHIGFDHAGPLHIRTGKRSTKKVYVLLLTCATTRGVHFELSPDLKAPAFIRAFKRFQSRRGTPTTVVHDNFKTFKSKSVKRFFRYQSIESKPILPKSPWWGGFYERIVRSLKSALRKTIGQSLLTYEELETVLCEVEHAINSRPLVYQSEDDLGQAITPLHLIHGPTITTNCIPTDDVDQLTKRLNYMQHVLDDQWKRFFRTYLNELRQHHMYRKDGKSTVELKIGDVVIVKDDNPLPRSRWPIGRVTELIRGNDDFIRGAKLRVITSNGLRSSITRPVQKLIPLEIPDSCVVPEKETVHNEPVEETLATDSRPKRKAAVDGQHIRRLREKYC